MKSKNSFLKNSWISLFMKFNNQSKSQLKTNAQLSLKNKMKEKASLV